MGQSTEDESDQEEPIVLPIDYVPKGCQSGVEKLSELKGVLSDIRDIDHFVKFLMPKIDSAAAVLLRCMEMKDEINAEIDE